MPQYLNGPPNGIQWCDATWNPVTGCLRGCRFGPNATPCWRVGWVIIGGMSGAGAVQPEEQWVKALERQCDRYGVPVFEKGNLVCRRGEKRRMEWPDRMR